MLPLWLRDAFGETFALRASRRVQAVEDREYILKQPLLFPKQVPDCPLDSVGPIPQVTSNCHRHMGARYHFLK